MKLVDNIVAFLDPAFMYGYRYSIDEAIKVKGITRLYHIIEDSDMIYEVNSDGFYVRRIIKNEIWEE